MFNLLGNKKGITMVEVVVSIAVLSVGILSLITLLPSSMRLANRSDYLGRASGILANQLQTTEATLLNPSAPVPVSTVQDPYYPSEQGAGVKGDVHFRVVTTVANLDGGANILWLVNVKVTWPGNATGISESVRVVRQQVFAQ
jgi:Tfp pilus assembly protein PilV